MPEVTVGRTRRPNAAMWTLTTCVLLSAVVGTSACAATGKRSSPPKKTTATKSIGSKSTTTKSIGSKSTTTKSTTTKEPAFTADRTVDVRFDAPGAKPRPIAETTVTVDRPVTRLTMNVTNMSYRGLVCGFSFRSAPPQSPVTIRMRGVTPVGPFDSGPLAVAWTALDSDFVRSDSSSNNGWNFSSEAHVNRGGPGWVVSLGGVTAEAPNVVPKTATCDLESATPLTVANSPISYWAGFAAV